MKKYVTPELGRVWLYAVHSQYLIIWAEIGAGGLIAYVSFLLLTIRRGWQCWMSKDRLLSPLALGFSVAVLGHMVHMLVDLFHQRPPVQTLWFTAGLITAMYNIVGNATTEAATDAIVKGRINPAASRGRRI